MSSQGRVSETGGGGFTQKTLLSNGEKGMGLYAEAWAIFKSGATSKVRRECR
jgi:hypothetical protein